MLHNIRDSSKSRNLNPDMDVAKLNNGNIRITGKSSTKTETLCSRPQSGSQKLRGELAKVNVVDPTSEFFNAGGVLNLPSINWKEGNLT